MLFQEKTLSRQPVAIDPIYDDDGNIIGFEPPAFLSPPATTVGGGERAIEEALKELDRKIKTWNPSEERYFDIPNEENAWE